MTRFFPRLMILLICATLAMSAVAEADEPPLPNGVRWGDSRERCVEAFSAGGYSVLVRSEDYAAARSPDRMLKRVREVQGISALDFEKKNGEIGETVRIYLYQDGLFQISITYDNTKKSFADKLVEDVSQRVSLAPQHVEGPDSKMEIYAWTFPATIIVFSCRYGPSVPVTFAFLEYRNAPVLNALKDKGLM